MVEEKKTENTETEEKQSEKNAGVVEEQKPVEAAVEEKKTETRETETKQTEKNAEVIEEGMQR